MDDVLDAEWLDRLVHEYKTRLPADYKVHIRAEDFWLVIEIHEKEFMWSSSGGLRSVEDKLAIAVELEGLRNQIIKAGVQCQIEKNWSV